MNLKELESELVYKFRNEAELIKSVKELSLNFTQNRNDIGNYLEDPRLVSAYVMFYLTTNIPKLPILLDRIKTEQFKYYDVIDVGCGPGTYLFAWSDYFKKNFKGKLYGVDTSATMRKQGELLRKNFFPKGNIEFLDNEMDLPKKENPRLLIFTNSFNEMDIEIAKAYVKNINPDVIMFLEPGTKDSFHNVMNYRKELLDSGFNVNYPCSQNMECPLLEDDWCHQYANVKLDPDVERLTQLVKKDRRHQPVLFHVYSKVSESKSEYMILQKLGESKFGFEWRICFDNKVEVYQLLKRGLSKSEQKRVLGITAGDVVNFSVDKVLGDEKIRIKDISLISS